LGKTVIYYKEIIKACQFYYDFVANLALILS
jgi:hypothetical protein